MQPSRLCFTLSILTLISTSSLGAAIVAAQPSPTAIDSLAMRVTQGTSEGRIHFRLIDAPSSVDTFSVTPLPSGEGIEIAGNSPVAQAVGLNRYLRDVAGIHICWNNLSSPLPSPMPIPVETISGSTTLTDRYYLNYCTLSYSMAFWDWERWQQEIDWMALHGVNMPLTGVGMEPVWRNVLLKLGYTAEEVDSFVPGPGYRAWWLMNNLEGWGGPVTEEWYDDCCQLQNRILGRMRSLGIKPVLPGYAGMIPHDAGEKLGISVADPGLWCGFTRPAFIIPGDEAFDRIADLYYQELTNLYGKSDFYSMDPFHEGGNTDGVNLTDAGHAVVSAMKRANPEASWVVQAWQANPRREILDAVDEGDMKVLDLYAEKKPQWGDTASVWYRSDGFRGHEWIYCMLLNFGGNVGMHGRMDALIDGFARAKSSAEGSRLRGVGVTAEGIENNPVMYELLYDLPWSDITDRNLWLDSYLAARYGFKPDDEVKEAWRILASTVYATPRDYPGEGTPESLLCARPAKHLKSVSTWGRSDLFYSADSIDRAATLLERAAETQRAAGREINDNFSYDLIDVRRQANATYAYDLLKEIDADFERGDTIAARGGIDRFMALLDSQDSLLSGRDDTHVTHWLDMAAKTGSNPRQRLLNVENAARLITVWGDSVASNAGGLHDYSHREWGGILGSLYRDRWQTWWEWRLQNEPSPAPDFWEIEEKWVNDMVKSYRDKIF